MMTKNSPRLHDVARTAKGFRQVLAQAIIEQPTLRRVFHLPHHLPSSFAPPSPSAATEQPEIPRSPPPSSPQPAQDPSSPFLRSAPLARPSPQSSKNTPPAQPAFTPPPPSSPPPSPAPSGSSSVASLPPVRWSATGSAESAASPPAPASVRHRERGTDQALPPGARERAVPSTLSTMFHSLFTPSLLSPGADGPSPPAETSGPLSSAF